jgi:hypothetical protein
MRILGKPKSKFWIEVFLESTKLRYISLDTFCMIFNITNYNFLKFMILSKFVIWQKVNFMLRIIQKVPKFGPFRINKVWI